ncbi:MAG: xanthine dehydrogenase family protein molybdopterin-binding subunit [Rhodospirillaceae bacterium]|nr:xanthine dehydrogenase family protein molybdopterin-binding subunit [Rhodospirillaceae bacterium]
MTAEVHHDQMKYAIGQSVPRTEDPKLLKGEGKYTDDLNLPDQVYAAIVRSPVAHGTITDINVSDAKKMPGVLLILTGYDLEDYGNLPCGMQIKSKDGSPLKKPNRPSLVTDKVRFVGDPVACVIAKTPDAAKDAAEVVSIDIDILPATTLATEAAKPGAPILFDNVAGNVALDFQFGDPDTVDKAFQTAHHISRVDIRNNRIVVASMEPRSALAHYNSETDCFTMRLGCQGTFGMRNQLAGILNMEREKVRVLTENVGGSFGMKSFVYPEYICLLHAAKKLSRPVKWTEERSSSFLSDQQGRDHEVKGELALNKEGDFLAVRLFLHSNLGGYLAAVGPNMATNNMVKNITSVYKTPLIEINTKCVFTNTTPISAYRGAGRPEANYYMERLIETAAREMGIDRMELRMRNHIRPDQIPYKAPSGQNYDSGNFPAILKNGLKFSNWENYEIRREISQKKGLLRGIGVSNYLEVTAPVETEMGGIRFEENGDITIITGTLDYGQGHAAPFAQVLHSQLGVPFEKIRLLQGDSDELITGGGTGGSKSIMASGGAIVEASIEVIKKAKQVASHVFEAPIQDIEFHNGNLLVAGTDKSITLSELSHKLKTEFIGVPDLPSTLDVKLNHGGVPSAFPNGCHVCEVEIDPETGQTRFDDYYMVNDFGILINPLMVEGQCHGGVAQGLGQAVMEDVVYDADGQVLSGSFMDYALPRASDVPNFHFASLPSPATTNALGVKGCGEAGCAGAMPAIMNAIVDALSKFGISHIDMPATPQKIWRAIQEVKQ